MLWNVRAYVALNSEVTKLIFATPWYTSLPSLFFEEGLSHGQQETEKYCASSQTVTIASESLLLNSLQFMYH